MKMPDRCRISWDIFSIIVNSITCLPLTALVIKKDTGLPGIGIGIEAEAIPAEQNKVFQYNWFGVVPPGVAELREAYAAASGVEPPPEITS